MPLLHLIIIAIIQGITEFLPISSSAHLILFPNLTGTDDQGQIIDVAVHFGTLLAVTYYFRRDVANILMGARDTTRGANQSENARLLLCLIIATIPAVILGLVFKLSGIDLMLRDNVGLIGAAMLGFGLVLWWADRQENTPSPTRIWTLGEALKLGLWQALALIPGASRSGITITGARFMGFSRDAAARLSMLMSIPVILAATTMGTLETIAKGDYSALYDAGIAACFAAISAFIALSVMMSLLKRVSFLPYVIYRVLFGSFLILWAYL